MAETGPANFNVWTSRQWNAYQLALAGLTMPLARHYAFDLVGGLCVALLGHPAMAGLFVLACAAIDTVQRILVVRWFAESEDADPQRGLWKLAALCSARIGVYLSIPFAMALSGGAKELVFFAIEVCTLVIVAQAAGAMARVIFWALASPVLLAVAALVVWLLPPWPALACLVSLATLTLLLGMISTGIYQAISTWHAAFMTNVEIVQELKLARDQALAEREAADLAREEARRAGRAKSAFLATMSHEIRTPMNGVLGMAQLLKRDEVDEVQSERLDVLIESGQYLLSILNDILDISKIDAGRLEIVPASENVRRFFGGLVDFWGARAEEKGVRLTLRIDPDLPEAVMMDALRMRQILFNLIGNALKFTEVGTVEVAADGRHKDGRVLLHVSVRDTGPGIAPDHLPVLFERFSQADKTEMRKFGGTGLGLAIVKQLTELMGGRIWVESTLGQGTTFHLEAPLAQAERLPYVAPAAEDPQAPSLPGRLDLLCVDDNPVNLLLLEQLLDRLGHVVVKAASGPEALTALDAKAFDLILMDIQMPGMSGVAVLDALRRGDGPNCRTPAIALTADVTSGGRERYVDAGFAERISKPIQIRALLDAMSGALMATQTEAAERRYA